MLHVVCSNAPGSENRSWLARERSTLWSWNERGAVCCAEKGAWLPVGLSQEHITVSVLTYIDGPTLVATPDGGGCGRSAHCGLRPRAGRKTGVYKASKRQKLEDPQALLSPHWYLISLGVY